MLSLAEIVTDVYFKLSVNSDNETYKKETVVIPRINSVMKQILADRKYNVILPDSTYSPDIKGGDLEFLRGNMFFDRVKDKATIGKAEAGDYRVEFKLTGEELNTYPGNGFIYLNGMILYYEGYTEQDEFGTRHYYMVFNDPLPMTIYPGTKIEMLYPIDENAEETYQLFSIVNGKEVEVVYSDYRYPGDYIEYRSILYHEGTKLIRLNLLNTRDRQQFKLNYYKKVTDLVEDTDVSLFPEARYDRDVLAQLVAGELLYETEKTNDGETKLIEGYGKLISFYDKFATINKGYRQNVGWNRKMNKPTAIIN